MEVPARMWGQRAQVVCLGLVEGVPGPGVLLCLFLCDLGPLTELLWASVPFIWYWKGAGVFTSPCPPRRWPGNSREPMA